MKCAARVAIALGCFGLAAQPVGTAQGDGAPLPTRLDHYLTHGARLTAEERNRFVRGEPVAKLLEADETKEVAVFAGVWINGSIRTYIDAIKDIESFERGGAFLATKRISTPPTLEDFAAIRLPDEDLDDLRSCRAGDCEIKLGEQALQRMRSEVDWKAPNAREAANAVMRRLAFEYVTRYLQGGNGQLAVYRDRSRPTFVAEEFRAMVDAMPELTSYLPEVRRYLLEFPKTTMPGATSIIYWQQLHFGLKPTLRISHLTVSEEAAGALVTSKMLYASHYFWTGLEIRALIADPARGKGFWLVTVSRSRSDGLSGFVGMVARGRAQSEAQKGALGALQWTKTWLEGTR